MAAKFGMGIYLVLLLVLLSLPHVLYGQQQQEVCGNTEDSCDPFQGEWVYDDTYPLYDSSVCNMMFQMTESTELDCQSNGRPDTEYLKYRWQPTACNLPRFDARELLSRLRGKSIAFVGEHLGFNQWQALICRLYASLPSDSNSYDSSNNYGYPALTFTDYGVTFMYYPSEFLVKLVSDQYNGQVLHLDSIDDTATNAPWGPRLLPWKSMDVLIFNSWYSWQNTHRLDSIVDGNQITTEMDPLDAYEKGLATWANWIDANIDPSRTKVFFQGISPRHNRCSGETKPASKAKSKRSVREGQKVLEKVLGEMSNTVYLLNITSLSELRPDAHPSVYNDPQPQVNEDHPDCLYWCISTVPDAWNHILYTFLLQTS